MNQAQKNAICRLEVLDAAGARVDWGTAFLAGPRLLLTARHVTANPARHSLRAVFTAAGGAAVAVNGDALDEDAEFDFAALELDGEPPGGVIPLVVALARPAEDDRFAAFGFPRLAPDQGLAVGGRIEDAGAKIKPGVDALQLLCEQATGPDAWLAGLSGGPCVTNGRVAGIVRAFPTVDGKAPAAATVFACPTSGIVHRPKLQGRLRLDPWAMLPSLPEDYPWPLRPFIDLLPYTEKEARIFFGRCAEIAQLLPESAENSGGVVLLYGQTGVGKSSLLRAGMLPRAGRWNVRYAVRERDKNLAATFRSLIAARDDAKPQLIVLDQLEEVVTRPRESDPHELRDLAFAVAGHLAAVPRDRVILAFRKEWLGEIEQALAAAALDASHIFVERLRPEAIEEVVMGVARHPALAQRWRLAVDEEIVPLIAHELFGDAESAIAPELQVLLTRLWNDARRKSPESPQITVELFEEAKRDGLGLDNVLGQRLARLYEDGEMAAFKDGLALDALEYHTHKGTAETRTREQRAERYGGGRLEPLVARLKDDHLLIEPRNGPDGASRLAHDALAPLIKERFSASSLAGQRTRRILENRADERLQDSLKPLDDFDLAAVEAGLPHMRTRLTEAETRLLAASRKARARRRRVRRALAAAAVAVVVALTVAGLRIYRDYVTSKVDEFLINKANALPQFFSALAAAAGQEPPSSEIAGIVENFRVARGGRPLPSPTSTAGLARIPGGTFAMGCSPGDDKCADDEKPSHRVTIQSFWIDQAQVTRGEYERVMGAPPDQLPDCQDPQCPILNVSWDDALVYCRYLGKRLPTEAEWEHAARGGTTGPRYGELDAVAWTLENSGGTPHPVRQKAANAFGLYDTLGNVGEWCADWYDKSYYSRSPADNPLGPDQGQFRVFRGSPVGVGSEGNRVSARNCELPDARASFVGFRCARR